MCDCLEKHNEVTPNVLENNDSEFNTRRSDHQQQNFEKKFEEMMTNFSRLCIIEYETDQDQILKQTSASIIRNYVSSNLDVFKLSLKTDGQIEYESFNSSDHDFKGILP